MVENKITTLNNLKNELQNCCNISDYLSLVKSLVLQKENFDDFCYFNKDKYNRNCIVRTDNYELILLCWNPGQKTPIHCHNSQECWMYIVSGEIKEEIFKLNNQKKLSLIKTTMFNSGKFGFINDDLGLHKISNVSSSQSISLHLYVKPIDNCRCFNEKTGKFEMKKLIYDTQKY